MTEQVVGRAIGRLEDRALVAGRGTYVDDIHLPDMLAAAFVRSPFAHAAIGAIDTSAALALPGVRAVYHAADLAPHLAYPYLSVGLPSSAYKQVADRPVLPADEACHVGQAVAIVVADTRYIAEDAAALVEIDYDPLPVSADCRVALEPGAPTAIRGAPHNVLASFTTEYGNCDAAFAKAPHVFPLSVSQHRGCGQAIECRGVVAAHDATFDRLTLWSSTQMPHEVMRNLVKTLGIEENQVRVVTPDVGGGFGPKLVVYPEEIVLAATARLIGRPVKWIEDRREHFVSTTQERDQHWDLEIAVDDDGRLIGIRGSVAHDHGAYTARGINIVQNSVNVVPGPYVLPHYRIEATLVLTNRVPVTPVRGAGHPQGIFAMERAMDLIARELGLDRAEVRRRNLIGADAMPYETPLRNRDGRPVVYDSGDYPASQAAALEAADYAGFEARRAIAQQAGRYRGIGIATYVKGTGRGPYEAAIVRIGTSGRISVYTGAVAIGQGTATMLAQICAEQLGGDVSNVSVVMGDTATIPIGFGTSASRIAVNAGSSVHMAAGVVRDKVLRAAARELEASEEDLEIVGRQVRVRGVPDLSIDLGDLSSATLGRSGYAVPEDETPGLEGNEQFIANDLTFANGTHVAEVEVDGETGAVEILNYVIVHDCGRMINPTLVDGQVLGGAVHGIGNALFERMHYDDSGQPLTSNLAEYLVPTAPELPHIEIAHRDTPSPLNPLGVKGVGESGTVPAPAAIASAVEDALRPFGVHITEMPLAPDRIIELIRDAETAG